MPSDDDLGRLLDELDAETRARWAHYLEEVDAEIREKGPAAASEHLEAAFKHLLAVGYTVHRCYSPKESATVMSPLGDAAAAVEYVPMNPTRPNWSERRPYAPQACSGRLVPTYFAPSCHI